MSSGPYNQWPQSNGFVAQQVDSSFYTSNDSQQPQQLQSLPTPYPQTPFSNVFVDTQQHVQYIGTTNTQSDGHTREVYTFSSSQTNSNLPLNTGSSQALGGMLDDSPELVQTRFSPHSQSGTSRDTFHQSKRPRPSGSREDPDLDGEVNPEKEGGRRQ